MKNEIDDLLLRTWTLGHQAGCNSEQVLDILLMALAFKHFHTGQDFAELPSNNFARKLESIVSTYRGREQFPDLALPREMFNRPEVCREIFRIWTEYPLNEQKDILFLWERIDAFFAAHYRSGGAHEYFTPADVSFLMTELVSPGPFESFYDPFCRSGDLIGLIGTRFPLLKMIKGVAREKLTMKMAQLRFRMLNFSANIDIRRPEETSGTTEKYDVIITNPPFRLHKKEQQYYSAGFWEHNFHTNRLEVSYLTHVLDHLSDKGRAIVVVPQGVLFAKGTIAQLRREIIHRNILDAVIGLPSGIFYGTGAATALLVFNNTRRTDKILLIDASKKGKKERQRILLSASEINNLVSTYRRFTAGETVTDENARVVIPDDLKKSEYDFQFSGYQQPEGLMPTQFLSPETLLKERERLLKQLKVAEEKTNQIILKKKDYIK